jgi:GT2 family glycosyltransferase
MDISIIIVNYNTKGFLEDCLNSIYKHSFAITFEIIVVDNASTDNSLLMIKERFKNVRLIENTENIGFGRANNIGIKAALGKYVFLLNSDTILLNNVLKIFYDFMEQNPKIAISGGALYINETTKTHSYGYFPTVIGEILNSLNLYKKLYKEKEHSVNTKVEYITGADMFIRKEVLDEVGLFDEDFFMYYEETELTYRIKKQNYLTYLIPEAQIIHFGDVNKMNPFKFKIYYKSKLLYFKKTNGIVASKFVKFWYFFIFTLRVIILFRKIDRIYLKNLWVL